jgi:DNA polymerase-3 subunit epsilon
VSLLDRQFISFDVETTGVNVETDRIVTASVVMLGKSGVTEQRDWLVNPGIPIPEEASKIHGITNEKAEADGMEAQSAVLEIDRYLRHGWVALGGVAIAMNASYDLSILSNELQRYGYPPVLVGPVYDPLVIDRHLDKYRKGKRTLEALAQFYGVRRDGAHSSTGDALTAARVAWAQLKKYPQLCEMSDAELMDFQREAHAEWAAHLQEYRRKQDPSAVVDGAWPMRNAA